MGERGGRFWETVHRIYLVHWVVEILHGMWNWSVVAAATLTLGVTFWAIVADWIAKYGYLPIFLIALFTFTLGIWAVNGVNWMNRQKRPTKEMVTFDYSYSFTLAGVTSGFDLENDNNTLEIRPIIRNASNRAFKYEMEKMEVRIEDRFTESKPRGAIVAAGSVLTIFTHSGFNKEAWDAFKTRTSGSLEFSVIYGHPDYGYSRRATKKCELLIFKGKKKDKDTENERDTIDIIWTLLSETDKEL